MKYYEYYDAFRSVAGSDADGKPKLSEDVADWASHLVSSFISIIGTGLQCQSWTFVFIKARSFFTTAAAELSLRPCTQKAHKSSRCRCGWYITLAVVTVQERKLTPVRKWLDYQNLADPHVILAPTQCVFDSSLAPCSSAEVDGCSPKRSQSDCQCHGDHWPDGG